MLLECINLTYTYKKGGKNKYTAVRSVGFSLEQGDFVSIIGKSGCGKSTLLNMLSGLLKPTSGKIYIDGTDIWSKSENDLAILRNSKIGYISQGVGLIQNLNAFDNVCLPFYIRKHEGDPAKKALALLDEVGLADKAGSYPAELSGGEMKRVAIARAMINDPILLIADEPTGDIDEETTQSIMKIFSNARDNGISILMATHDLDNIQYGNRLFKMTLGVLEEQDLEEYLSQRKLFL